MDLEWQLHFVADPFGRGAAEFVRDPPVLKHAPIGAIASFAAVAVCGGPLRVAIDADGAWACPPIDGIAARTMSPVAHAARMMEVTASWSQPGIEKHRRAPQRDVGRGPERSGIFLRTPRSAPRMAALEVVVR
jgi:hypothetical protein